MKKYSLLIFASLLSSCAINGNFKGLYSYYNSTYKSNPGLFTHQDILNKNCENLDVKKIHITNGKILKQCISNKQRVMVYIWTPLCQSKFCYRLEFLQQYFDKRGVDLYVVSEYYDLDSMEKSYNLKNPIFGIDTKYYKTSLTDKYMERFQLDLMNKVDLTINRLYYFENGVYVNSFESTEMFENLTSSATQVNSN